MIEDREIIQLRRWMALWVEIDRVYIGYLKQWDLSLNAFWLLEYLYSHPQGAEPTELADEINVMRQLVTIILNDFEKRGFILRKESKLDHRKRIIQLSKRGLTFAKTVCESMYRVDLTSFSALSPEERDLVVAHAQHFCDALKIATGKSKK